MEVTVLGSSAAWPGAGRAAAGVLIQHDGSAVALDLGTGTLSNLQLHVSHQRLDAVMVTHEHLDQFGDTVEVGPFRIAGRLLPHSATNLGFRVKSDGESLAYAGDTGPSREVEELARDVDLLISEASWEDESGILAEGHLTARQAAEHGSRAGARRLLLTHFWPTANRDRARDLAAEAFAGEVVTAQENQRIQVGG